MAKMRLIEITRSLQVNFPDLRNKDVLELLRGNGFEVKSVQSSIEDDAIGFLLKYFQEHPDFQAPSAKSGKKASASKKSDTAKKSSGDKNTGDNTAQKKASSAKASEKTEEPGDKDTGVKTPASDKNASKNKADNDSNMRDRDNSAETKESSQADKAGHDQKNITEGADQKQKASDNDKKPASSKADKHQGAGSDHRNSDGRKSDSNDRDQSRDSNRDGSRDRRNGNRDFKGRRNDNGGGRRSDSGDRRNGGGSRNDDRNTNRNGGAFTSRNGNGSFKPGERKDGVRYSTDGRKPSFGGDRRNSDRKGGRGGSDFGDTFTVKPDSRDARKQNNKKKDQKDYDRNRGEHYNRSRDNKNFAYDPLYPDGIRERKKKDPHRKGAFIKPKELPKETESEDTIKQITLPESLTIKELADAMKVAPAKLIKDLLLKGSMVTLNHELSFDEAEEIALNYNYIAEKEEKIDVIEELMKDDNDDEGKEVKRPPVVCVMGHVDHGKTSLLDAIRETHVTTHEAGGITQHIGAYVSEINGQKITFLDTPGHEAFTAMRMRGAQATDIAVLVVAADDGVMPQTVEAISHAKAAGVEIIVAVNKIDKPGANVERVKQELTEYGLTAEDWGGDTIFVPVSAHTKEGIDTLLEMILLTAEVMELKANPKRNARGVVIEAKLDKGRGAVATVLVQKGTLKIGDNIAVGAAYGKVRAMTDDQGRNVKAAGPSVPVEIIGLHDVPDAGEIFMVTDTDKEAKNIAEAYVDERKKKLLDDTKSKLTLDGLFSQIQAGKVKQLDIIVKADVQGSTEAVKTSLLKLSNEEVAINVIHAGVGAISESDVELAIASNAIIIGFNVRPDNTAKEIADREKVDVRLYKVIYDAIEDIERAMKGMLDPIYEEKVIAHLEVRQTFKASGVGVIAGSYVLDGKIERDSKLRITRDGDQIFDGPLASLKRFKDDAKEVAAGYECGIVAEGFNDIQVGDQIEAYKMVEVPRQ
jgi:translation initiation factor IF-2